MGYEDFRRLVMPLLGHYGLTATLFVTTGWVRGPGQQLSGPNPMLSLSQITEASQRGIEIGAHSHTRAQLDQMTRESLRARGALA